MCTNIRTAKLPRFKCAVLTRNRIEPFHCSVYVCVGVWMCGGVKVKFMTFHKLCHRLNFSAPSKPAREGGQNDEAKAHSPAKKDVSEGLRWECGRGGG